MRPDYKNWIPKKMITGFGWACAVLIVPAVMFALNSRWLIAILSGLVGIGCGLWSLWCRYAYSQFSYEGERKLSKQIVEGIAEYIDLPEGGIGSVRVWERKNRTIRRLRMTAMTKEMIQKRKREQCAWRNRTRKEEL